MRGFLPGVECRARPLPVMESQDALYVADRERSCVLESVLTLLYSRGGVEDDTPHQGESLALLCGVTDRRTGSEDFSEEIRTFKSKMEG